jgi:4-amino-4-deoxy-L-arabinose transferase-like glycosyltransferase
MNVGVISDFRTPSFRTRWAISVGIFILALMVRIPALDKFVTADEPLWLDNTQAFADGLLFSDYECQPMPSEEGRQFVGHGLECTYSKPHPGVTTTWGGSLGLLTYYWLAVHPTGVDVRTFLQTVNEDTFTPEIIAAARMPLVAVAALFVCLFYLLLRRLLDDRLALLAALLLALQPFHIAHSRVLHHDALTTTFMGLSLLTMLGYWLQAWKRPWLLASAALAGLAFLSKPVGWLMIPYAGLLGLLSLYYRRQRSQWHGWPDVRRLIADGLLWAVAASLTYFALFPALWVIPGQVMSKTVADITRSVESGHTQYFLGHVSTDPGPLFYPIGWLLRASPLEVLGVVALLVAAWRPLRPHPLPSLRSLRRHFDAHPLLVAMALFLVMLLAYETASSKKMIRYFLPAFPVIDVFASLGLIWLAQLIARKWREVGHLTPRLRSRQPSPSPNPGYRGLTLAALIIQASLALSHYPYYLTYYNPLLGGGRVAQRLVTIIGWGEGLDLAADYLNQKPDVDQLKVTTWYKYSFKPFFQGRQVASFFSIGDAMASDYLVFYQNQLQRQLPDPDLLSYFQEHYAPEHIVHLKGIDYALIYPVLVERRTNWEATNIFGKLILYGYRQEKAEPGTFSLRLVWENQGMSPEDGLWLALRPYTRALSPADAQPLDWQLCALDPAFAGETRQSGALLESVCQVNVAALPPGVYSVHIGEGPLGSDQIVDLLAPQGDMGVHVDDTQATSLLSLGDALDTLAEKALPSGATPLHTSYADMVALIGSQVSSPVSASGHDVTVQLYWQALQDIPQADTMAYDFRLRFRVITSDGKLVAETSDQLLSHGRVDGLWPSGQVLADPHPLALPDNLSPGSYRLAMALARASSGEPVPARDEATGVITTDYIPLGISIDIPE